MTCILSCMQRALCRITANIVHSCLSIFSLKKASKCKDGCLCSPRYGARSRRLELQEACRARQIAEAHDVHGCSWDLARARDADGGACLSHPVPFLPCGVLLFPRLALLLDGVRLIVMFFFPTVLLPAILLASVDSTFTEVVPA